MIDVNNFKGAQNAYKSVTQGYYQLRREIRENIADILASEGKKTTTELSDATGLPASDIRSLLTPSWPRRPTWASDTVVTSRGPVYRDKVLSTKKYVRLLPDGSVDMNDIATQTNRVNVYYVREERKCL